MATPSLPLINLNPLREIKREATSPPPQQSLSPRLPDTAIAQTQQEGASENLQLQPPQFLKSVDDLVALSASINNFKLGFEDLQKHLDFIRDAIGSQFEKHRRRSPQQTNAQTSNQAAAEKGTSGTPSDRSEIDFLCETMCSRGLRKFMSSHLSDTPMLRDNVPAALKLAPKPAKLVSESIGRFYLQGRKAYTKDSPMITAREAAILTLECFLLMMGDDVEVEMDSALIAEMQQAAIAWRKRLLTEGSLSIASEVDARGLLFFIACFGIPSVFKPEDISNLLRLCNTAQIVPVLKRSRSLLAKLPEIIGGMVKNGLHVEAIDVASSFGVEDKFPPQAILTTVLRECKEAHRKARQEAKNLVAIKQANGKQLAVLKSVVKCVEDRNWDLTKLLGGWQINEKMVKLEKDSIELDKQIEEKAAAKRKLDDVASSGKLRSQEMKRSRFAFKEPPLLAAHPLDGLLEQRAATLANGIRSYEVAPNTLTTGLSSHLYNYPAPQSEAGLGLSTSYAGARREIGIDRVPQMMGKTGAMYAYHEGDDAVLDRSVGQSSGENIASAIAASLYGPLRFAGRPDYSSSSGGPHRAPASDLYRFADEVVESESFGGGSHRPGGTATVSAYHPSYMY